MYKWSSSLHVLMSQPPSLCNLVLSSYSCFIPWHYISDKSLKLIECLVRGASVFSLIFRLFIYLQLRILTPSVYSLLHFYDFSLYIRKSYSYICHVAYRPLFTKWQSWLLYMRLCTWDRGMWYLSGNGTFKTVYSFLIWVESSFMNYTEARAMTSSLGHGALQKIHVGVKIFQ